MWAYTAGMVGVSFPVGSLNLYKMRSRCVTSRTKTSVLEVKWSNNK